MAPGSAAHVPIIPDHRRRQAEALDTQKFFIETRGLKHVRSHPPEAGRTDASAALICSRAKPASDSLRMISQSVAMLAAAHITHRTSLFSVGSCSL